MNNKIKAGIATVLSLLALVPAVYLTPVKNEAFEVFDSTSVPNGFSEMVDKEGLARIDPNGDRFVIKRENFKEMVYLSRNRMDVDNNTIRISLDENLSERYAQGAIQAAELYKNLFDIINPNIKIEIGYFGDEQKDILVKEVDKDRGNAMMAVGMLTFGPNRVDMVNNLAIYNICDNLSDKTNLFSFVHEYAHAIFGMSDYSNNNWTYSKYGYGNPVRPMTIMNYYDLVRLENATSSPKFTSSDVALAVKQWGLYSGLKGENPFASEEEYWAYVESRLPEICYTEQELIIANTRSFEDNGKMSLRDYLKLMEENKYVFETGGNPNANYSKPVIYRAGVRVTDPDDLLTASEFEGVQGDSSGELCDGENTSVEIGGYDEEMWNRLGGMLNLFLVYLKCLK